MKTVLKNILIRKNDYEKINILENDKIELLNFVSGG